MGLHASNLDRDAQIVRQLSDWFVQAARPLPWRTVPRDPYRSLVSELMLQQTQVSRVVEKFGPFIRRFPSVASLAVADESEVLAEWSGLGYYRRARLLHSCAKAIVERFGGEVPRGAEELLSLPGIGRYTAGAIASIVFGEGAAIVDGNVCRVLQRLEAKEGHAGDRKVTDWAWGRAEQLVPLTSRGKEVALFNEGLMELGATVCTPDAPRCVRCPLSGECTTYREGLTDSIPAPKPRAKKSTVHHDVVVVYRNKQGGERDFLLEQRSPRGLWAGLWQPPAWENNDASSRRSAKGLLRVLGLAGAKTSAGPSNFVFHTTHREVRFRIWTAVGVRILDDPNRKWIAENCLNRLAISNAHRAILLSFTPSRKS